MRQTKIPVVKRLVMGRWKHYSKSRRREFTLCTNVCRGKSLRIHLRAREGHLLYYRGLPGSYRGAFGVLHHSYIKLCHYGVILHHNNSFEYFNSFYVPMTSCCIVITNYNMCQLV